MAPRSITFSSPGFDYSLPWPDLAVPKYRGCTLGGWKISRTTGTALGSRSFGYFRPFIPQPPGWMLRCRHDNEWHVWMSLTLMEQESHMPHLAAAVGDVVVAGLGMGMFLYNLVLKPEVQRITVLEHDPKIVKLFFETTKAQRWPNFHKVNIITTDALEYTPSKAPDFLYADIWKFVGDENALRMTQQMQKNIRAKEVGYWTQEFDFAKWGIQNELPIISSDLTQRYQDFIAASKLPLIGQQTPGYAPLALAAVAVQASLKMELNQLERDEIMGKAIMLIQMHLMERAGGSSFLKRI